MTNSKYNQKVKHTQRNTQPQKQGKQREEYEAQFNVILSTKV